MRSTTGNARDKVIQLRGPVRRVLVIGRIGPVAEGGQDLPDADHVYFAEPHEIGPDLTLATRPDLVISALFGPGWDAVEVAAALSRSGFTGRYRALTPNIPDAALVRREVRRAARTLDFDVILTGQPAGAAF